jgi:formate dehydrogenase major subunit
LKGYSENMSEIKINIDGKDVVGKTGQTILDLANLCEVYIPTLCHDDRVETYGACGICIVEAQGNPKLLRACSTMASDGMVITTNSPRIIENRKTTLELLLSDHTGDCKPPCTLACPAQTDCQGYVGLIANGEYEEALKLIKDKIPLPASIGRVCPHPCEDACRREMVEEPISIAFLKQFAGDIDLNKTVSSTLEDSSLYTPPTGADTGIKIAVIGGGPGGLTAAYFLRIKGHGVTVYDAMPHMGGMLRYGIPEYRLPKDLLQREIDAIEKMGAKFHNNVKIGKDVTLDSLREKYDAVIVAVGAWKSMPIRCSGEGLANVVGGIEFLQEIESDKTPIFKGQKVAVVGGGNTAMDACRTAVRLGADEVYNIYRRTRNEMPAEEIEIIEAEEEGVNFLNLTDPLEILGDEVVTGVRLQIMELGEPDDSGRRRPVPVPGKEETIAVDHVIVAIGQKLEATGLEAINQTKWGTIAACEETFRTNLEDVFAIGDATNDGADIAITAIGEAKDAVEMVDRYLKGEKLEYREPYLVKSEKSSEDFADQIKESRQKMPHRSPQERRGDFEQVNFGFTEEQAKKEAHRCLECGCMEVFDCKLLKYAKEYEVTPEIYAGKVNKNPQGEEHPFIRRDPNKCILCGLCVRFCDEVVVVASLGLANRGFDTCVKPAFDESLQDADCIACGGCVSLCPTGALVERQMIEKQVPLQEEFKLAECPHCDAKCQVNVASKGKLITRSLPVGEDGILCQKGRFGFPDGAGFELLPVSKEYEEMLMEKITAKNLK